MQMSTYLETGAAERKQVEEALRESEERYRTLVDLSPDTILVLSEGRVVYVNSAALSLYGAAVPEELIGRPAMDFIHPDYREMIAERMQLILQHGQRVPSMEAKMVRLDGQAIQIEGQGAQIIYEGKSAIQVVLRDITERKRAEEKLKEYSTKLQEIVEERTRELKESQAALIQAGKMEAIGQLAAGVAHELNNPLGAVVGYADILLEQGSLDESSKAYMTRILRRAEQAAKIVRQLKDFAQPSERQKNTVDLSQIIGDTLELVASQMSLQKIRIATHFDPQVRSLWADRDCLQQVFLNIALNAQDAMPQGGELTITTRRGEDGRSVEIELANTGIHIPAENLEEIFNPFFTSGKNGRGTGLGLSISQRIVQDHGGVIRVESKEDQGTAFTIVLPRDA